MSNVFLTATLQPCNVFSNISLHDNRRKIISEQGVVGNL